MFGKVFKNHKLKIQELVLSDTQADVFTNPIFSKQWEFDRVVLLKEDISPINQTIYSIDGTVSYDPTIRLDVINDMEFDESQLPIIDKGKEKVVDDKPDQPLGTNNTGYASTRKTKTEIK